MKYFIVHSIFIRDAIFYLLSFRLPFVTCTKHGSYNFATQAFQRSSVVQLRAQTHNFDDTYNIEKRHGMCLIILLMRNGFQRARKSKKKRQFVYLFVTGRTGSM